MALDLSVAIIFKNEIRCIERCLQSLQPLKERLSCEIVMADTGSSDGSRAIAEQYADTVFDFLWVNDFAAARNAVLGRCFGRWVLVVDCDEWLDSNVDELVSFLQGKASVQKIDSAALTIRDYLSASFEQFQDFVADRLFRMASEPNYEGVIHERMVYRRPIGAHHVFDRVVLYHDGYVMFNDGSAEGRAKRDRNRALLRKELESTPDSPRVLLQYLESSANTDEDFPIMLRRAIGVVEEKKNGWREYGAIILRHAAFAAYELGWPELQEWSRKAKELFPKSYYTRIDGSFIMIGDAIKRGDNGALIANCEAYLAAYDEFPHDPLGREEISRSALQRNAPRWKQFVELRLAGGYCTAGQPERALPLLRKVDWTLTDPYDVKYFIHVAMVLSERGADVGALLGACWNGIQQPVPSAQRASERVEAFRELVGVEDAAPPEPTPSQAGDTANVELEELAQKIRSILARYPADDPAIVELKNSEVYQKVAYLIEE